MFYYLQSYIKYYTLLVLECWGYRYIKYYSVVLILQIMAANSRIRHLIAAAANSVASYEDDDDFESILNTTRRCFRPRTSRGRKPATYMKKKTFLLRRSNTDYFPIRAEIDCLTQCGLGKHIFWSMFTKCHIPTLILIFYLPFYSTCLNY